jgi:hypothetical protein
MIETNRRIIVISNEGEEGKEGVGGDMMVLSYASVP